MSEKKWCKEAKRWFAVAITFSIFLVTALLFVAYVSYYGAKREGKILEVRYYENGEKRTVLLPDTDGIPCVFYITEGDGKMWIDFIDPTDPDRKLHTVQLPGKTVTLIGADGLPITYIMDNGVDNEGSTAVEGPKPTTPKGGK